MESQNITIDPQTDFKEGKAEPLSVPLENTLQRSSRIKKIQTTAMILLFLAAVINYLDRSSLSVANLTIRQELGLNATEIGALLSVFSLAYGIAQLPCGPLLDRKGPRIMLGLGMFFWSLFQALSADGAQLYPVRPGSHRHGDRRSANEPLRRQGDQRLV